LFHSIETTFHLDTSICDFFRSILGALFDVFTFDVTVVLVFFASSVAFALNVHVSLKTNHDEIDFQLKVTVILRFVDTSSLNLNTGVFQIYTRVPLMRRVSPPEIFISRFTTSAVGGVMSGRSHAEANAIAVHRVMVFTAADVAGVIVVMVATASGTNVAVVASVAIVHHTRDEAIHILAKVCVTAFWLFSRNFLIFLEKDILHDSFEFGCLLLCSPIKNVYE
jgi:hypothetical protein